jgi:hypothetical protein
LLKEASAVTRGSPRIFNNIEILYVDLIKSIFGNLKNKKIIIENIRKTGIDKEWREAILRPYWFLIIDEKYNISILKSLTDVLHIQCENNSMQIINFTSICINFEKKQGKGEK